MRAVARHCFSPLLEFSLNFARSTQYVSIAEQWDVKGSIAVEFCSSKFEDQLISPLTFLLCFCLPCSFASLSVMSLGINFSTQGEVREETIYFLLAGNSGEILSEDQRM